MVKPKNILALIHRTGRQWVSINCENEVQCVRLLICILSIRSYESTSFVWIYTLLFVVLCGGRLRLVWFCRLWCQDDLHVIVICCLQERNRTHQSLFAFLLNFGVISFHPSAPTLLFSLMFFELFLDLLSICINIIKKSSQQKNHESHLRVQW